MNERHEAVGTVQASATKRAEWTRPELRKIEAAEAETLNVGINADGGYS